MKLLVMGGTSFVGRAIVGEALKRNYEVTTFNRGVTGDDADGVEALRGDRTIAADLGVLEGRTWDAACDTCGYIPKVVLSSSQILGKQVGHYGFVSTLSVYPGLLTEGASEDGATFESAPDDDFVEYGTSKVGCEMAVRQEFGEDRCVLIRAGLILGPHENVDRLPWWLRRIAKGGEVLAPAPEKRPIQAIDARDIAIFMLDAAEKGTGGTFNVTSRPGLATMGEVLELGKEVTKSDAGFTWVDGEWLVEQGVGAFHELPIWVPENPSMTKLYEADVSKAYDAGLTARPIRETVADTWAAMAGKPAPEPREGAVGMAPEREAELLAAWKARSA